MFFFESFYYFYSLKTKLFYNEMKYIRLIFSAILLSLCRSMRIRTKHDKTHWLSPMHNGIPIRCNTEQYACTRIYTYSIHPNKFLS